MTSSFTRSRIAFQGLADIHATLPTGDRWRVTEDAKMLMTHWANPQGGFQPVVAGPLRGGTADPDSTGVAHGQRGQHGIRG